MTWNCCYDQLRTADDSNRDIRSGQQHVLKITASTVTVRFRKGKYGSRSDTWIGTVCAGDGVWQGEFFLIHKGEGDDDNSLLQEPCTGIMLENSKSGSWCTRHDRHDTTVLVVREQEQKQEHEEGQEHA